MAASRLARFFSAIAAANCCLAASSARLDRVRVRGLGLGLELGLELGLGLFGVGLASPGTAAAAPVGEESAARLYGGMAPGEG